jgi:mannan endo-1,4-beta-mannosidase
MQKYLSQAALAVFIAILVPGCRYATAANGKDRTMVSSRDGRLYLNGREYRAAGVNIPNLSQSYMGTWHHDTQIYGTTEKAREAMVAALDDLAKHKIPFIRFFAGVGYPVDAQKLYMKDREAYWRQMDELFELCRERNIRLIPSLTIFGTWAGYHGEHKNAILDPESKTYASAYGYVREFVTRYRDDPVVLLWELHNEIFLHADLNFTGRKAGHPGVFLPDTPGNRGEPTTIEDYYNTAMLARICGDMTRFIKAIDPNHLVTTGDAHPRDCSKSLRENWPKHVWTFDTIKEHCDSLLLQQARPLDVISLHIYGNTGASQKVDKLPIIDYAQAMIRAGQQDKRPVLIGEFGQGRKGFLKDDPEAAWFLKCFDMFDTEGVSLITLWTVHFPWQKKDFNLTNCAAHPVVFERMARFNKAHAAAPTPLGTRSGQPGD